jgi:hypothetical protein
MGAIDAGRQDCRRGARSSESTTVEIDLIEKGGATTELWAG